MEHGERPELVGRLRAAGCVFAEEEAAILLASAAGPGELEIMAERRIAGDPLEQVVGWAEFYGHRLAVRPGVFVPRRRSELLVTLALKELRSRGTGPVLDLCCGSGAVALALARERDTFEVYASDLDPAAVACAKENLGGLAAGVYCGDLFDDVPAELRGRCRLIVANAPYVPRAEVAFMPAEARLHEPLLALDGGDDGLDFHRRIAEQAGEWLAPSGAVLIECGARQLDRGTALWREAGFEVDSFSDDHLAATALRARSARNSRFRMRLR